MSSSRETITKIYRLIWPAVAAVGLITAIVLLGTALGVSEILLYFSGYLIGAAFGIWGSLYYCREEVRISPIPIFGGALGGWFGSALGGFVDLLRIQAEHAQAEQLSASHQLSNALTSVVCAAICGLPGIAVGMLLGLIAMGIRAAWLHQEESKNRRPVAPQMQMQGRSEKAEALAEENRRHQPVQPKQTRTSPRRPTVPRRPSFWLQGYWNMRRQMDATAWALLLLILILIAVVGVLLPSQADESKVVAALQFLTFNGIFAGFIALVILLPMVVGTAITRNQSNNIGRLILWVSTGRPIAAKIVFGTVATAIFLSILWWRAWLWVEPDAFAEDAAMPSFIVVMIGSLVLLPGLTFVMSLRRVAIGTHGINVNMRRTYGFHEIDGFRLVESKAGRDAILELRLSSGEQPFRWTIAKAFVPHIETHLRYHMGRTFSELQQRGNAENLPIYVAPNGSLFLLQIDDRRVVKELEVKPEDFPWLRNQTKYFARNYETSPEERTPIPVDLDLLLTPSTDWGVPLAYLNERGGTRRFPVVLDCDLGRQMDWWLFSKGPAGADVCSTFADSIAALGGEVRDVLIADLHEIGRADVRVGKGDQDFVVQVNACDAVPLAIATGAPLAVLPQALRDVSDSAEPINRQWQAAIIDESSDYAIITFRKRQIDSRQNFTTEEWKEYQADDEKLWGQHIPETVDDALEVDLEMLQLSPRQLEQYLWLSQRPTRTHVEDKGARFWIQFGWYAGARLWHTVAQQGESSRIFTAWSSLITTLGGSITRLSFSTLKNRDFICHLHLETPHGEMEVETSAYCGLALASVIGVPIQARPNLFRRLRHDEAAADIEDWLAEGERHAEKGEYVEAIASYSKAIQASPEQSRPLLGRAFIYFYYQSDWQRAQDDLTKVIELDEATDQIYFWRAITNDILGQPKQAIEDLNAAIELRPDNVLYLNFRGSLKCLTGDADGALQDLNAAIRIDARFSRAYRARGAAYLSLGEFEKAALNFRQADELDTA